MPKSSARKKSSAARSGQHLAVGVGKHTSRINGTGTSRQTGVQMHPATRATSIPGMIMPAMVALGCWGLAFTLTIFSTDPNHVLFGGMAALMALMWSASFGVRVRKVVRQK